MQLAIGDARDRAIVGLEDHGDLVGVAVLQVALEAVVRGVELTVLEPGVERRPGFVEDLGEGLVPQQVLVRQARPEAFVVALGLGAQGAVGVHAGDVGLFDEGRGRLEDTRFLQNRFNASHDVS